MAARGQWAETGMGAVVLIAAAAFFVYALSEQTARVGRGYTVTARFGDVGALASGADVRVAGVKIGTVSSVALDPKTFLAETRLDLDPTIKLPSDSTAKITADSLLGGAHVVIAPGGAPDDLKPGSEIQNTQGAVDLFGLIGQFIRPQQAGSQPASAAAPGGYPATAGGAP
jgi:phospholipid/cholesterol/gamma-HCH transport system substrate-binding protein